MVSLKICLYGPTGSGKSTLAEHLVHAHGAVRIKVAEPLYDLQRQLYEYIDKPILGQDGELLQYLGQKIEAERPGWLGARFVDKVHSCGARIVVNDDCRPNSFAALRDDGFVFVGVRTSADTMLARLRSDHTPVDPAHPVEQGWEQFRADFEIDNNGPLEVALGDLDRLVASLGSGRDGWLSGKQIEIEVGAGRIVIDPFDSAQLNPNSYNYKLAPDLKRITSDALDLRLPDEWERITIPEEGLVLLPGECYLGTTVEVFGSDCFASLITGRSSVGRKFVTNHVTAGLVDQGFNGNLTLEITVAKPTRVYPYVPFGQVFWFTVHGPVSHYGGKYQSQSGPAHSRMHEDGTTSPT